MGCGLWIVRGGEAPLFIINCIIVFFFHAANRGIWDFIRIRSTFVCSLTISIRCWKKHMSCWLVWSTCQPHIHRKYWYNNGHSHWIGILQCFCVACVINLIACSRSWSGPCAQSFATAINNVGLFAGWIDIFIHRFEFIDVDLFHWQMKKKTYIRVWYIDSYLVFGYFSHHSILCSFCLFTMYLSAYHELKIYDITFTNIMLV